MGEWLPIETAPRDDRLVLLYQPGKGVTAARFDARGTVDWWRLGAQGERPTVACVCDDGGVEPTHWMPLPTAPPRNMKAMG